MSGMRTQTRTQACSRMKCRYELLRWQEIFDFLYLNLYFKYGIKVGGWLCTCDSSVQSHLIIIEPFSGITDKHLSP